MPNDSISNHLVSRNLPPDVHVHQTATNGQRTGRGEKIGTKGKRALRAGGLEGRFRHARIRYLARACGWRNIPPALMQVSNHQCGSKYYRTVRLEGWTRTRNVQTPTVYRPDDKRRKKGAARFGCPCTVWRDCRTDVVPHPVREFCEEVITRGYLNHPNTFQFLTRW